LRTLINLFLLLFFLPFYSFGQKSNKELLHEATAIADQGDYTTALADLKIIKQSKVTDTSVYMAALMLSSEINTKLFNCDDVIKDNEDIIKIYPSMETDCQTKIARFKRYLGDHDGSIIAYKRILQLQPNDNVTICNMALSYNLLNKYDETIKILKTIKGSEHFPQEYYQYAIAYYHLHKLDSAKDNIDKYLLTDKGMKDQLGYKDAALIYSTNDNKTKGCEYITKANELLISNKIEAKLNTQPENFKACWIYKNSLKEIEEIKSLKSKLCN
jgi:tetratricopeptide (TPR) repeat protein